MKIEKVQWERVDESDYKFPPEYSNEAKYFGEPICNDCNRRASWVLRYDVLEHSFWHHACSDHKATGQFIQFAGKECTIIEAV